MKFNVFIFLILAVTNAAYASQVQMFAPDGSDTGFIKILRCPGEYIVSNTSSTQCDSSTTTHKEWL